MLKAIITAAVLCTLSNVYAHEWLEVGDADGDAIFVDVVTTVNTGDGLKLFWMLVDHKQSKESVEGEPYRSTKMMHAIDCSAQLTAIKMIVYHALPNAQGRVVRTLRRSDDRLDFRAMPQTELWRSFREMFCKK
jgi:hypothetical protein